jgi:hypothetical protein
MSYRKLTVASLLATVGLLGTLLAPPASAAGPLLSGYGGPGAGEQAVLGSALLNARGGGEPGSGGPKNTGGPSAGGPSAPGTGSAAAGRATGAPGSPSPGHDGSTGSFRGDRGSAGGERGSGEAGGGAPTYVYPSSLRSAPASPALGLSGRDLLLALAVAAGLAVLGTATIRIARLQR